MATLTRAEFMRFLRREGACDAAMAWIRKQRGMTPRELWWACSRYDWLWWVSATVGTSKRAEADDLAFEAWRVEYLKPGDNREAAHIARLAEYRRHIKWRDVERAIVRKIRAGKKRERSAA